MASCIELIYFFPIVYFNYTLSKLIFLFLDIVYLIEVRKPVGLKKPFSQYAGNSHV